MAMTRIFYLGGLNIPKGSETGFDIKSGQEVFRCPPVGQYLDVPDYVARDIMSKYGTDVFNTNQQLAKEVASGKVKFERTEKDGKMVVKEVLSDEEILARAEEIRAKKAEAEKSEEPDKDDEPDTKAQASESQSEDGDDDEEETKKPTRRRKKKG